MEWKCKRLNLMFFKYQTDVQTVEMIFTYISSIYTAMIYGNETAVGDGRLMDKCGSGHVIMMSWIQKSIICIIECMPLKGSQTRGWESYSEK